MKRAAIYVRVSTTDQSVEPQLLDLREMAKARGYEIVREYSDTISGTKAKRPGLNALMADASKHRFDAVFVWAFDRMARSVRHFLEVIDEFSHLRIDFISFRENIDTSGPLGRAIVVILSALAELELNITRERIKCGMRRARLEGRRIGREPMQVDRTQIVLDRQTMSLTQVAKRHGISRASVCRIVKQASVRSEALYREAASCQ